MALLLLLNSGPSVSTRSTRGRSSPLHPALRLLPSPPHRGPGRRWRPRVLRHQAVFRGLGAGGRRRGRGRRPDGRWAQQRLAWLEVVVRPPHRLLGVPPEANVDLSRKLDLFWSELVPVLNSGSGNSRLPDVVQLSYTVQIHSLEAKVSPSVPLSPSASPVCSLSSWRRESESMGAWPTCCMTCWPSSATISTTSGASGSSTFQPLLGYARSRQRYARAVLH